jgi:hypothetical protein
MFIQIGTMQAINMNHVFTFFTDDRGEDYPERYVIQISGTHDRSWCIAFKQHSAMIKAFNELLRLTKTVEWNSD